MNLYIDLTKAVQIPSTSTDRVDGRRAARAHEESFNRRGSGAMGGDPSHDDPAVGGKWAHEEGDDDLEANRKRDSQISAERGITPKKDEPETKKSQEAVEILKSFSSSLREQTAKAMPNEREVEYLTTVCGYDVEDVVKGHARIVGSERSRFNDWLHQRLQASISRLVR